MASDFRTPPSHAITDESGVISKSCFVRVAYQLIPPDMMVGGYVRWFRSALSSGFIYCYF